jgi:hypothetical protein
MHSFKSFLLLWGWGRLKIEEFILWSNFAPQKPSKSAIRSAVSGLKKWRESKFDCSKKKKV